MDLHQDAANPPKVQGATSANSMGILRRIVHKSRIKAYRAEAEVSSDESVTFVLEQVLTAKSCKEWIVDSGATTHMCNDKTLFTEMNVVNDVKVSLGDGRVLKAFG